MEPEPLIHTDDLSKRYPMGGGELLALKSVTLAIAKGEFAGLVGPSGSGKTTLLNIVGSLDVPSEGSATVLGRRIETLSHEAAAELRSRHIGFIFQTFNLLPVYTVYENVEFPLLLLGTPAAERRRAVMEALDRVHLADRASSRPAQLSGGQSQRVAIARAIVKQPALVLADEPTANLDAENSTNVIRIMDELNRELGATFLFSTHDEKVIRWLRRRISLADGAVVGDEAQTRPAGGAGAP